MQIHEICDKSGRMPHQEFSDEAGIPLRTAGCCLSDTTKAPNVYTVGTICCVMHVSLDNYFGIERDEPQEQNELTLMQLRLEHERKTARRAQMQNNMHKLCGQGPPPPLLI